MVILTNEIPVYLINPNYHISIEPCDIGLLGKLVQYHVFKVHSPNELLQSTCNKLKRMFENFSLLTDDNPITTIGDSDILIFVAKVENEYKFNRLVIKYPVCSTNFPSE